MFLLMVIAIFVHTVSGERIDRIIGGKTSFIGDLPGIVSLQKSGVHFCGATIIRPNICLTAAHCVKGVENVELRRLTARVGSTMWSVGGQVQNIIAMKIHPKYNLTTKDADIAMIKLGSAVANGVSKIVKLANDVPIDGEEGLIGGWGLTDENGYTMPNMLQVAEVTAISRKKCSQPPWDFGDDIRPTMICAQAKGKDACQGDSGGPYISKSTGKLVGVVSWGRGCGRENYPGVYAAVAKFYKWITKNADEF